MFMASLPGLVIFLLSLVALAIVLVACMFSEKNIYSKQMLEAFECGFSPIGHPHGPLSVQFLLVGILFLIFDIEVIIILPVLFLKVNFLQWVLFWTFYFMIMLWGLLVEVEFGTISWGT
uniref:NADH-ubiquinone oxidoreductase chain 3 n=1 Tax=Polyplax asiatica TaxID=1425297 RepID=V9PXG8_9NEOP|nr:NADH dehydrogenase subunit 3 [Polyplax asiatica]